MALDAEKRRRVKEIFEKFLGNRAKKIRGLTIRDFDINPFLVRLLSHQLGLENSRAIVKWILGQRLERGSVTSFGKALEKATQLFSDGTGVEGADVLKTKDGRHHHIQVKSGPNTVPKDLGVRIAQLLRSAQRRNRGSLALYAMCYGTKRRVSGIVRKYVQQEGGVDWLSGREFWQFISDDPDCVDEIYAIAGEVGRSFRDTEGGSLSQIIAGKLRELTEEFEMMYGAGGAEMWNKLLEENT